MILEGAQFGPKLKWVAMELHLAQGQTQGNYSSRPDDDICQFEHARDKAMAKAWLLWQELEEEKDRHAVAFQWIQNHQTVDIEKNLSL